MIIAETKIDAKCFYAVTKRNLKNIFAIIISAGVLLVLVGIGVLIWGNPALGWLIIAFSVLVPIFACLRIPPNIKKNIASSPEVMRGEVQKFTFGDDDFRRIIENGDCYVDKTLLIRDLLELGSKKVVLFSRPRRFGKTLNMNMLKTFFELEIDDNGKVKADGEKTNPKLFEGLKIGNCLESMEHLGRYPVISISFFNAKKDTWEQTYQSIKIMLSFEKRAINSSVTSGKISSFVGLNW
jgi:hypothetical protein